MGDRRNNRDDAAGMRESAALWHAYRSAVDELERGGKEDPLGMLARHTEFARGQIVEARRVLAERFGVRVGEMGLFEASEIDASATRVDVSDGHAVAELADTLHRLRLCEDIRIAINRSIAESRQEDKPDREAASGACEVVMHVLRSRGMLFGSYAFVPEHFPNEPAGLRAVRAAATDVLAGWTRWQLRLGDWGMADGGSGANRLHAALAELALPGESIEDVMLRELPGETIAQIDLLLGIAEDDPERAAEKLNHKSLRNRVAGGIEATASDATQMARAGYEVSQWEAVEEQAARMTLTEERARLAEQLDEIEAAASLSPQQRQIIHLARQGKTNAEIAATIDTSKHNVEKQRSTAIQKMHAARGSLRG